MKEKVNCVFCGRLCDIENIEKSRLCTGCIENLKKVFELCPEKVVTKIHAIQKREGNGACFNTGGKENCGQENCEWRDVCDSKTVESAV